MASKRKRASKIKTKRKKTIKKCCKQAPSKFRNLEKPISPKKENLTNDDSNETESCLWDKISNYNVKEKEDELFMKYAHQMKNIKMMTSDDIKKFIIKNQEHFIKLKSLLDSERKITTNRQKKLKINELKDIFKCNPFSSIQQLVMYDTLREIFKVPKTHFMECRHFFTVVMPEICCQLFAEIFKIKISSAPRLMKKLYPNPICPV